MPSPVSLTPLAAFYFAYFAFFGLFSPFWGLYLQSLSFSPWQISLLVSLSTLARIVAPGFWGWLADVRGHRRPIIVWTSLASAACFALVGVQAAFGWMFAWLALSHFFWAAALPLIEASTAQLTQGTPGRYSQVRLWGSLGFVALSLAGGYLLEWLSLAAVPWLATVTLIVVAAVAFSVPDVVPARVRQQAVPIWASLRQRHVQVLFAVVFLMAFAHGPYYVFYSIALEGAAYSREAIGALWALGVVAEVGVFWAMPRLMRAASAERLMQLSLAAAVLRFVLLALCLPYPALAVGAQLLHGLTFGVHHAAAIALLHRHFPPEHQARAQGLYIVAGFGVGGSAGGLLSGLLWPQGGTFLVFGVAALSSLLTLLLAWRALPWRDPDEVH